jgi:hypothetical protein
MTPEDRENLHKRIAELTDYTDNEAVIGSIMLLTDRLIGMLDGILNVLRAIEEHLANIDERAL